MNRHLCLGLALAALAGPASAEAPFGSPAWVREQEARRQAEDARLGRRPAAPPAPVEAASPPVPAAAPALPLPSQAGAEPAPAAEIPAAPAEAGLPLPEIAPSAKPLSRMALGELKAFRQRPLFAPSRRRPESVEAYVPPPPSPPPVQPESPPPELRLVGIVAGVERAVALVSRSEGASLSLRVGDHVEAWRVERIGPDRVVLREGEREQTYRLFALPPATAPRAHLPPQAVAGEP